MGEIELLKQLKDPKTKQKAFSFIVAQYSKPLYWKIRSIVLYHEDADDVLQNTFLKAWKNIDTFKGSSQISTWLYRIAINESLDFLRNRRSLANVESTEGNGVAQQLMADEYFEGDEGEALLQEAIAALPEVQRTIFLLRYYDEMKYAQMSKLLDTSEGALKASYHLATKKIQEYIKRNKLFLVFALNLLSF